MPRTLQKKNNFNHGMVVAELVERQDLEILNKSAALLENITPIIYGGLRSRRGTTVCDKLFFTDVNTTTNTSSSSSSSTNTTTLTGTVTSSVIPSAQFGYLQGYGTSGVQSGAVGTTRELLRIDYTTGIEGATFTIKDIKLDFELPTITTTATYSTRVITSRVATTPRTTRYRSGSVYSVGNPGRGYRASDWVPGVITDVTVNALGELTAVNPTSSSSTTNYGTVQRAGSPRTESVAVQVSADGETWATIATIMITEIAQTFTLSTLETFRYIRLYRDSSADLATSFSLAMMNGINTTTTTTVTTTTTTTTSEGDALPINTVRTLSYVYNNEIKYLLVLGNKNIFIYRDGRLVQQMFIALLSEDILPRLKYAAKDDTIIFTHPDIPPQRLMRIGEDQFSFAEFPLKNIPYELFGTLTTTHKTSSITPSATDGSVILTGSGFTEDMVGQYIDNAGGAYVKITEYISATKIRVRTIVPFYTTDAINSWDYISGYEPVWSNARGWPRTCLFVQQRLCFGGSRDMPNTLWMSRVGDYNNFLNIGNYDNDAIYWPLTTNSAIVNMAIQRNMHIFTSAEEWTVPENSFTPNKFVTSKMNENGCWDRIIPAIYDNSVLTIEKKGRNLYFYGYDESAGGFRSQNISLYLQYEGNPIDLALEKNSVKDKGDFLYVLVDNGVMYVQALGLSENINAPCIYKTDGKILSVCAVDGDVYLVVVRANGVFLERITDNRLDAESSVQVINGYIGNLENYIGKRVYVEQGDKVLTRVVPYEGEIEVASLANTVAKVGLPFEYKLISNPIAINGQTTAIRKRINRAVVETLDTDLVRLNGQTKRNQTTYNFYAVSAFEKDCRYEITGEYSPMRILSVQLDIAYEG